MCLTARSPSPPSAPYGGSGRMGALSLSPLDPSCSLGPQAVLDLKKGQALGMTPIRVFFATREI